MTTATPAPVRPMKLYAHSYRRKPGTEEPLPYRRGPFASMDEWDTFRHSKHGRKMELCYVLVDEETNPPTIVSSYGFRSPIPLPYLLLVRSWDGALLTGDGTVVFEGGAP
jgi:hypothetical protein